MQIFAEIFEKDHKYVHKHKYFFKYLYKYINKYLPKYLQTFVLLKKLLFLLQLFAQIFAQKNVCANICDFSQICAKLCIKHIFVQKCVWFVRGGKFIGLACAIRYCAASRSGEQRAPFGSALPLGHQNSMRHSEVRCGKVIGTACDRPQRASISCNSNRKYD